jgi:predicted amidohydrolase
MKKLKVGLVQAKIFYNPKKSFAENDEINYKHCLKLLKKFKKNEVDLIVFPEYYPGLAKMQISKMNELLSESKRINAFILCGEEYKKHNSATLISPQGKIKGRYYKQRLWGDEIKASVKPSKSSKIFNIRGVKVGVLICYDFAYKTLRDKVKKNGAEILVIPSLAPPAYLPVWKSDVVFSSNVMQLPIAHVNCGGIFKSDLGGIYGGGQSKVVIPSKENFDKMIKPINVDKYITKKLGAGEGILKYTIKVK